MTGKLSNLDDLLTFLKFFPESYNFTLNFPIYLIVFVYLCSLLDFMS